MMWRIRKPVSKPVGGEFPHGNHKTRTKRAVAWKVLLVCSALLSMGGQVFLLYKMEHYVPSSDDVLDPDNWEHILFVKSRNIEGVCGTHDVASTVYKYETASSSDEFWSQIEENLISDGWTRRPNPDGPLRRYVLLHKKEGKYSRAYEARIGMNPATRRVAVGYVSNNCRSDPDPVAVRELVAHFADERVWPKLREIVSDE